MGRFFADSGTGSGVTSKTISFDKPFENDCSIISVTQLSNDAIRNIMATPAKSSFNLSFEGGKSNEELAYFAIGY
ncbi:gp53-like domain-containing protein [Staphylococcus equorum]|uniref:gp53-like domain-containing protein n=1 Tax=Staphylococcus equorum TaxID=246432 RepID=UPI003D80914C